MRRTGSATSNPTRRVLATCAIGWLAVAPAASADRRAGTLGRLRDTGGMTLGYVVDREPLSYRNAYGRPQGYAIALCQAIAMEAQRQLGLPRLTPAWIPLVPSERFRAVQLGRVDLLCGGDSVALSRMADVAFSIPIFPGGIGALVRSDVPVRLRQLLEGREHAFRPYWRASAMPLLRPHAFTAVGGTKTEQWLESRFDEFHVATERTSVVTYEAGVRALLARKSDVLFGDRAALIALAAHHPASRDLSVIDRLFTYEPLALVLARNDDDFRLLVDRTLSRLYRSGEIAGLYADSLGDPDENTLIFFRSNALRE
jgi:putrescine:ornithine antiporter